MTKRILFVDDDRYIRTAFKIVLEDDEYKLVIATSGNEAYEFFKQDHIDAVVTDCHMLDGDGLELTERIRRENKDIPIVIISGSDMEEDAIKAGANRYLPKPVKYIELKGVLDELL